MRVSAWFHILEMQRSTNLDTYSGVDKNDNKRGCRLLSNINMLNFILYWGICCLSSIILFPTVPKVQVEVKALKSIVIEGNTDPYVTMHTMAVIHALYFNIEYIYGDPCVLFLNWFMNSLTLDKQDKLLVFKLSRVKFTFHSIGILNWSPNLISSLWTQPRMDIILHKCHN